MEDSTINVEDYNDGDKGRVAHLKQPLNVLNVTEKGILLEIAEHRKMDLEGWPVGLYQTHEAHSVPMEQHGQVTVKPTSENLLTRKIHRNQVALEQTFRVTNVGSPAIMLKIADLDVNNQKSTKSITTTFVQLISKYF